MAKKPLLQSLRKNAPTVSWILIGVVALLASIGLVMMFMLAQATKNREAYERNYQFLVWLNVGVVAVLFVVLGWMAWRMWRRLQKGKFGSRLLLKLALVFVLVASVPGALIYVVAYQFVSRSIESWFDVKVETALVAGLNLGRSVLDTFTQDTGNKTQAVAATLATQPAFNRGLALEGLRVQQNAERLVLWSQSGQQIAASSMAHFAAPPPPPSPEIIETLKTQPSVAFVEGLDEAIDDSDSTVDTTEATPQEEQVVGDGAAGTARIVAYALVRPAQFGLFDETWVLQLVRPVPADVLQNALMVQEANRDYQERSLARTGMQRMFIGTLTLTLFLAVFGAVLLAALLAAQIARPLLYLAEGVKQVAAGDLSPKHIDDAKDELGGLTRSFAQMTQQLFETRQALTGSMAELDASRSELQTILDNLTSGVLVLREDGTVLSANPGAGRILGVLPQQLLGKQLDEIPGLTELGVVVQQQFDAMLESEPVAAAESGESADGTVPATSDGSATSPAGHHQWQHSMELNPVAHEGLQQDASTLVLRGALLPDGVVPGARLLVFEDISAIISAQRTQAWGEVARRLAHEIKNPLTPIQLSAERLEMKLTDSLEPAERNVLTKSVRTIVEQVDAMKRLVNEFRDYARLPAAQLRPVDLNRLILDVLQLYGSETATVPVHAELDPACQPVLADAEQMRQVLHNLLQNAQDAQQQAGHGQQPVEVQTQWRPASARVRLTVCDAGPGFPEHILQRAFEPYVTTKIKGTGLGLAVVKKIADEHGA
ncbi:MAG: ATP-binding protein, partial [Brachymonas sp.]|nr:ATP-binding protein [Brachymonas sp.]